MPTVGTGTDDADTRTSCRTLEGMSTESGAGSAAGPVPDGAPVGPSPLPGIPLGAVAGVPVYLSKSWFLIAAVVVLTFGPGVARTFPELSFATAYLVAAAYAVLLAVSVLCHEAAHAVVARRVGYSVRRVVVNLWGGQTEFSTPVPTPGRSAVVAVAGPLANMAAALIGVGLLELVAPGVPRLLVYAWTVSNGFVALFNLLPALPLDGGFLVEALLWHLTGRRSAGMVVAAWAGRAVVLVAVVWLVVLPMARGERVGLWSVAWLAFLGALMWVGASEALATGRALRDFEAIRLDDVVRPVIRVPLDAPAAAVGICAGRTPGGVPVLVGTEGLPVGLVDPVSYRDLPADRFGSVPAGALLLAQPEGWLVRALPDPRSGVAPLLGALTGTPYGVIVLQDDAGQPVAVLTSEDVERAVSGRGQPDI